MGKKLEKIVEPEINPESSKLALLLEMHLFTEEMLKILFAISTSINLARSFEEVGRVVFDGLEEIEFQEKSGGKIAVYDEKNGLYEIFYYRHHAELELGMNLESRLADVECFSKLAIEKKSTILITDSYSEEALSIDPRLKKIENRSMIFIPLFHCDKLVGLFSYSSVPKNSISQIFTFFLEGIGKLLTVALYALIEARAKRDLEIQLQENNKRIVNSLKKEFAARYHIRDIVTNDPYMHEILKTLPAVAISDVNVLIEGATGTGKELIASAIHNLSNRREKPYMIVDCGALAESLAESELFGHKKGAFTGAERDTEGKLQAADGGTIFLDEIGELSPNLQVKLLRVMNSQEFTPVGSTKIISIDVRFISATNKDLKKLIEEKQFREDLYHRIVCYNIFLPPLNERRDDIPYLVEFFIKKYNTIKNKNIKCTTEEVMDILLKYDFPGNIRELEKIIECTFINAGDVIKAEDLPDRIKRLNPIDFDVIKKAIDEQNETKKTKLIDALKRHNGNKTAAGKDLRISRKTVDRRCKKYKIK